MMSEPELPQNVRFSEIAGAPGYGISSDGVVWSRRPLSGRGAMTAWRQLKPIPNRKGYHRITLMIDNQSKIFSIHRIVLEQFIGPCPPGMEAAHNNNDSSDNHAENLRWDTRSGNFADKYENGTAPIGSNHPQAKLTEIDALQIRDAAAAGEAVRSLVVRYGVTRQHIHGIIKRKTWKHI